MILGRAGIIDALPHRPRLDPACAPSPRSRRAARAAQRIVVTELPYQTSVEAIAAKIAELVDDRRDRRHRATSATSRPGDTTRLVIELKRDANAQVVLNNLYKHTPLQTNFAVNMVALVDGVPRTLNLREALQAYVDHQVEVITRRTRVPPATRRATAAHIVEGLLKALDMIDAIIALIRGSERPTRRRDGADGRAVRVQRDPGRRTSSTCSCAGSTRLERPEAATTSSTSCATTIAELEAILADDAKLRGGHQGRARRDPRQVRRRAAYARSPSTPATSTIVDLIDDEELVVVLSHKGYVKTVAGRRVPHAGPRRPGRARRQARATRTTSTHILTTTAHSYLLFFSNRGRVYRLRAHEIPMKDRTARGTAIVNLLPLQPDEHIQAIIDTRDLRGRRVPVLRHQQRAW